jgi:ATP-dependent exoDNAse (exonuclease V) beta subunit
MQLTDVSPVIAPLTQMATGGASTRKRSSAPLFTAQQAAAIAQIAARHVVTVEDVGVRSPRPSGKRFGTLVHALLASVPLAAGDAEVRELATLHSRLFGSTDEERVAAAVVVGHALRHSRMAAAREAELAGRRVWREAPVSLTLESEAGAPPHVLDGQCDLAYESGEGWVIVDFKTDAEMASSGDNYRQQVALYAEAVHRATGVAVHGVLLRM